MRVIAKRTLREFWRQYADAKGPLEAWFREVQRANWASPQEIKDRYASASFVGNDRVIFNIGGNKYRLIVRVNYQYGIVYIRFIGTHADYNRIGVEQA